MKGLPLLQQGSDRLTETYDFGNVPPDGILLQVQHRHGLGIDEQDGAAGVQRNDAFIHKFQERFVFPQYFPQRKLLHDGIDGSPEHAACMKMKRLAGRGDAEYAYDILLLVQNGSRGADKIMIFRAIVLRSKKFPAAFAPQGR